MDEGSDGEHGDDPYGYGLVQQGDIPNFVGARDEFCEEVIRFIHTLREAGADVPANAGTVGIRAVVEAGFDRQEIRTALRTALVSSPEDIEIYDRQFPSFWRRLTERDRVSKGADGVVNSGVEKTESAPESASDVTNDMRPDNEDGTARASPDGVGTSADVSGETLDVEDGPRREVSTPLVGRSDGSMDDGFRPANEEIDGRTADAVEDLTEALTLIKGRRWAANRNGETLDIRRALRDSATTGGAVVKVPRRERLRTDLHASIIVDVSESVLDVIDRGVLLEFLHAAVDQWRTARVFFFDTDLKEVTTAFDTPTFTQAAIELEQAEATWGGGTRIGESLATLRHVAPRAVDRRTVVLLISDGLDVGGLDELADEMAWLGRTAPLVLWLNPLAGRSDYEPTARGMTTALPYVDGLFPFASPGDLGTMAAQLRRYGPRRSLGYQVSDTTGGGATQGE